MSRRAAALALAALALVLGRAIAADDPPQAPPARCAPRLQVFFASDFTDQAYQRKTYQKVAAIWKRPPADPKRGAKAVVITTIGRDGKATPPLLHMKSGSDVWDAAALTAVKAASPFDPLPATYLQPGVEVHFHFECAG